MSDIWSEIKRFEKELLEAESYLEYAEKLRRKYEEDDDCCERDLR